MFVFSCTACSLISALYVWCVCVYVYACAYVWTCACVRARVRVWVGLKESAYVLISLVSFFSIICFSCERVFAFSSKSITSDWYSFFNFSTVASFRSNSACKNSIVCLRFVEEPRAERVKPLLARRVFFGLRSWSNVSSSSSDNCVQEWKWAEGREKWRNEEMERGWMKEEVK